MKPDPTGTYNGKLEIAFAIEPTLYIKVIIIHDSNIFKCSNNLFTRFVQIAYFSCVLRYNPASNVQKVIA